VRSLTAGDRVALTGILYTGRDRLHKHLAEGGACPVTLRDGGLFHCGPVVLRDPDGGWRINAAGPTTSMREEPYMAKVIAAHGLRVVMGKGGMGDATREACRIHGCVYLQAVGGAAAVIARQIKAVRNVWFLDEFGPTEAMWQLEAEGIEAVVGIDAHGRSLYDEVAHASRRVLDGLLAARR
jgi:fumarate hydratase class I